MKVVRKTILDKILSLLPDDNILRIELNNDEFDELCNAIDKDDYHHIVDRSDLDIDFLPDRKDYCGSYLVIKGTCIQTCSSYK